MVEEFIRFGSRDNNFVVKMFGRKVLQMTYEEFKKKIEDVGFFVLDASSKSIEDNHHEYKIVKKPRDYSTKDGAYHSTDLLATISSELPGRINTSFPAFDDLNFDTRIKLYTILKEFANTDINNR